MIKFASRTSNPMLEVGGVKRKEEEDEKNRGGFFSGLGYLGHKAGLGAVGWLEGIWDSAAGGLADLFGADKWAEEQIKNTWVDYNAADAWYNPDDAWRAAGDVAHSIGNSLPSTLIGIGLGVATGGMSVAAQTALQMGTSFVTSGLSAAGHATKEAYEQTGKLGKDEWGYGAMSGALEGAIESAGDLFGIGTGAVKKMFGKNVTKAIAKDGFAKTLIKSAFGEAAEEAVSTYFDPYLKRATYDKNAENATIGEIGYSALIGGLSGMIMGGGGYGSRSAADTLVGARIANSPERLKSTVEQAEAIAEYESRVGTENETLLYTSKLLGDYKSEVEKSGGAPSSFKAKQMLAELQRANVASVFQGEFGKAVTAIARDPEGVADTVNKFYKDTKTGESMNVTAESLTKGLDLSEGTSGKKYSKSIAKALKSNSALRTLAVLQVAGRLNMNTEAYTDAVLSGNASESNAGGIEQLVSQQNVQSFLKNATPAEVEAVAEALGVESFEDTTPAELAERIRAFEAGDGAVRYRETKAKMDEALAIPTSRARKTLPANLRLQQGQTVRYIDGDADIAIMREGSENFRFFDYKNNVASRKLTREEANRALAEIRKAARGGESTDVEANTHEETKTANKAEISSSEREVKATKNSKVKHALKRATDGNTYVDVSGNLIGTETDPQKIVNILSNVVRNKFNTFVDANGQKIGINQKTAKEWVRSKSAATLMKAKSQMFSDKMNAFENADELLKAAKDYVGEARSHQRKDNFVEFARGFVDFKVGANGYEADVIVGTTKSGVAVLYDIVNIQTKKIVEDTSYTARSRRSDAPSTTNSIPNSEEKINPNSEKSSEKSRKNDNSRQNANEKGSLDNENAQNSNGESTVREKIRKIIEGRVDKRYISESLVGRERELAEKMKKQGARVYSGELTESEARNLTKAKLLISELSREGLIKPDFVIAENMDDSYAYLDGRIIVLGKETLTDGTYVRKILHEICHFTEGSREWRRLAAFVFAKTDISSVREQVIANYKADGVTREVADATEAALRGKGEISEAGITYINEVVAHKAEELLSNSQTIGNLTRRYKSVTEKLLDRTKKFFTVFKRKTPTEKKALAELSRMEKLYSKALESMGEGYVREKVRVRSEEVDSKGEIRYNKKKDYAERSENGKETRNGDRTEERNSGGTIQERTQEFARSGSERKVVSLSDDVTGIQKLQRILEGKREANEIIEEIVNIANGYYLTPKNTRQRDLIRFAEAENIELVFLEMKNPNDIYYHLSDDTLFVNESVDKFLFTDILNVERPVIPVLDESKIAHISKRRKKYFLERFPSAYLTRVTIRDFLDITTENHVDQRMISAESRILSNNPYVPGIESTYDENMYLKIDLKNQKVLDHEGRHRMTRLLNEGNAYADIFVIPVNDTGEESYSGIEVEGQYNEKTYNISLVRAKSKVYENAINNMFWRDDGNVRYSRKGSDSGDVFEEGDDGLGTVTIKTVGKDKKRYKEGFKGAVATRMERSYISFFDEMYGVQRYLERTGTESEEAKGLIQAVRASPSQAQTMIGSVQYNVFAKGRAKEKQLGKGIQEIYKPLARRGGRVVRMFDDYLFHHLNIDKYKAFQSVRDSQEEDLKALHTTQDNIEFYVKNSKARERDILKLGNSEEDMAKKAQYKSVIEENNKKLKKLLEDEEFLLSRTTAHVGSELERVGEEIRKQQNEKARLERVIYELGNSSHYMKKKREYKEQISDIVDKIEVLTKRRSQLLEMNKMYNYALKPVFNVDGETVTMAESESYISKYDATHPEFRKIAEEVWAYAENLNRMRESAGLISSHIRKRMHDMYPHYVPAWRAEEKNAAKYDKGMEVSSTVKKAQGYNHNLEWIEEALAAQTKQVLRNGHINVLANGIYDGAVKSGDLKYVDVGLDEEAAENLNHEGEGRPKPHKVSFYKNGAQYTMDVSDEIFRGFKGVTEATVSPENPIMQAMNFINDKFKKLVTSLSPAFTIRNAIRDMQDAGINTRYGVKFLRNIPVAWKEILTNSERWQLYRAHGGFSSTVFDSKGFGSSVGARGFETIRLFERIASGEKFKAKELAKSIKYVKDLFQGVENVNAFIEQIPRFAEFISAMNAGASVETAIYDSAEVTTNFGRRGALVKHLNSTLIPFLNPAMQGFDKIFRNVGDAVLKKRGAKAAVGGLLSLFLKAFLIGMVPMILNALLYSGDEDYEKLRETDKENNYLIKLPNGSFFKLPRGRMASVYAGFANRMTRMMQGKDGDWGGYFSNVVSQVTPVENATRMILSPIISDVRTNTTWYGTAIEGPQFDNVRPSERYDESTSSIAIALGKAFNYSPKKIHYLIDQYSGVIGDFLLPATTAKAEKDFFSGNFTIDPVTSNKLSTEFYKLYDEAKYAKTEGDTDAIYQVKYFNEVASAVSVMYDEISAIQNGDAKAADKLNSVRTIRAMINAALENAINDYEAFSKAVSESANLGYDDSNATQQRLRYTEIIKDVYGAERALKTYNKDVYAKMGTLSKSGISYEVLYDYYFELKDIDSERDENGNAISGSKRKKVVAAIAAMDISLDEKLLLLTAKGYALKDGDVRGLSAEAAKRRLAKYIVSLKISTEEKVAILEECGFTVKNGRVVLSSATSSKNTAFAAPKIKAASGVARHFEQTRLSK